MHFKIIPIFIKHHKLFSHFKHIPQAVWIVGWADALIYLSGAITFSLFGPFMEKVLGLSILTIGVIEAIAELSSWVTRFIFGGVSDYLKQRRFLIIIGYVLTTLSRPVFAMANGAASMAVGRFLDQAVQATPRDALIGDAAPSYARGACFGLKNSLGLIGAIIGSLIAILIMHKSSCNYRLAIWISMVPAILSCWLVIKYIKDVDYLKNHAEQELSVSQQLQHIRFLRKGFWLLIVINIFFMLGRSSEVFMVMHLIELGLPYEMGALVMVVYNSVEALISYPMGAWSDQIDRRIWVFVGVIALLGGNILLGIASSPMVAFGGVVLWGVQLAVTYSVLLTMVTDTADPHLRATAYSIFYITGGVSLFTSNALSGVLVYYTTFGQMYLSHAVVGFFAIIILGFMPVGDYKRRA